MERQTTHSPAVQHGVVKQTYDEAQSVGRYEEGMARMALYHRHCQDPVIFRTLGDIRGKSLLDQECVVTSHRVCLIDAVHLTHSIRGMVSHSAAANVAVIYTHAAENT